jgi:Zn-dependent protease
MLRRAVHVTTAAGVPVRLDPSLVLIVALVTWTFLPRLTVRFPTALALGLALLVAVLVVLSVLAHELGHAAEARRRGVHVGGVTLFALGGATELGGHGRTPRDELAVAALGPWISLVVAAACGITATVAEEYLRGDLGAAVALVAGLLGWINVALAAFNLLPAAPLDGGRMLHALLWRTLRDRHRATLVTSALGQLLGAALLVLGGFVLVSGVRAGGATGAAAGLALGGVWSLVIGVFLLVAARGELRRSRTGTRTGTQVDAA